MKVTITTYDGDLITGTVKSESWREVVIVPDEPDVCEWRIQRDMIKIWNEE